MENDLSFRRAVLADSNAAVAQNLGVGPSSGMDNAAIRKRRPSLFPATEDRETRRPLSDEELGTVAGGPTAVEYAVMPALIIMMMGGDSTQDPEQAGGAV